MRIRTVKPDFWTHPVMVRQSHFTRLLALALLNYADDEGYFYADEDLIRGALFPKEDSTMIRRSIDELSRTGYLTLREHPSHGPIGRIESFRNHQRIDRPKPSGIKDLYESTNDRRTIDDESTLEGKGREGKVKEPLSADADVTALWKTFSGIARTRSSKKQFSTEYRKAANKPPIGDMIESAKRWVACHEWTKDNCQYAPAAHLWIKRRQWEDEPEQSTNTSHGIQHRGLWD